jgi:hypothetical protein
MVLVGMLSVCVGTVLADPYFQIWDYADWEANLMDGHVYPLPAPEWDEYFMQWQMYTEEGIPYPSTQFIEPILYPYEGPPLPPDPEGSGGLVMAWGGPGMPDGPYAAAWKYDYLVDPNLSNAQISLVVFPPQWAANGGAITQISFGIQDLNGFTRSWYWNVGPGQPIQWNVPTPITINCTQVGLNATNPPATGYMSHPSFDITKVQWFIADENGQIVGGQVPVPPPGGPQAAVWNYWYNIVVSPVSQGYAFEFSLDIGSDTEMSDPFRNGNEGFDPGDVYWWQGAPVLFPGRDGFKDDMMVFGVDPWPDPPDPMYATAVPVGFGSPQDYWNYFDLDGHDQLDISFFDLQLIPPTPLPVPIPQFGTPCILPVGHLYISMDDDMAPGWPVADVPVTVPSPGGVSSYGSTPGQDEILGVDLALISGPPPYPIQLVYPYADEVTVHPSLAPNPDGNEMLDDDVDSLDIVPDTGGCPVWYFSPDHEGHIGLDPGGIYEYSLTMGGPVQVIDEIHLGIPEDADVDAFEFVFVPDPMGPAFWVLGVAFSVDEDDPLTPIDESGGLPPNEILVSTLMGFFVPLTHPLWDDIDALTCWHTSFAPQPTGACCFYDGSCTVLTQQNCLQQKGMYQGDFTTCAGANCIPWCLGDANCDAVVNFTDIQWFVAALTGEPAWVFYWQTHAGTFPTCPYLVNDVNGSGGVEFTDISPFINHLGQPCDPYIP